MNTTETYRIDWEGIALSVRWTPNWLNTEIDGHRIAHLELVSDGRVPLPVTETGHRSHFTSRQAVKPSSSKAARSPMPASGWTWSHCPMRGKPAKPPPAR
jgi:hypothetical protein